MSLLATVEEAAEILRCSPSLIYALVKEGSLPAHRIGAEGKRGKILIDTEDLNFWLASRKCHGRGGDEPS